MNYGTEHFFHATDDFEAAQRYLNHHRHAPPPLYNPARLLERPLPAFEVEVANFRTGDESEYDIDEPPTEVSIENVLIPTTENDPLGDINPRNANDFESGISEIIATVSNDAMVGSVCGDKEPLSETSIVELAAQARDEANLEANVSLETQNNITSKEFVPLFEMDKNKETEIMDLLDDKEIYEAEDVTMVIGSKGVPKPMKSTMDGLMKQEDDAISSNIPFNKTVSNIRTDLKRRQLCIITLMFYIYNRNPEIAFTRLMEKWSRFLVISSKNSYYGIKTMITKHQNTMKDLCRHFY